MDFLLIPAFQKDSGCDTFNSCSYSPGPSHSASQGLPFILNPISGIEERKREIFEVESTGLIA